MILYYLRIVVTYSITGRWYQVGYQNSKRWARRETVPLPQHLKPWSMCLFLCLLNYEFMELLKLHITQDKVEDTRKEMNFFGC